MILLDTHVWFYWVNDNIEQLSQPALKSMQTNATMAVSIISCWEIAMLVSKNRLRLSLDVQYWINQALKYPRIKLMDIDPEIVVLSTRLPGEFHSDPADRLIVATCMKHAIPLVTKDQKIHAWQNIKTIW
jgi:PIN domain nuclease of toxin-antitoxin system